MPKPRNRATTRRNKKSGGPWKSVQLMMNATQFFDQIVGPGGWKRKAAGIAAEAVWNYARR